MTIGIRVRNPTTGEIVLDLNDRLTTVLGTHSTGTNDGSLSVPSLNRGEPFMLPLRTTVADSVAIYPEFSISSDVISWVFTGPFNPSYRVDCPFIYGVVV